MSLRMIMAAAALALTLAPVTAQEMDHSKMDHGSMGMEAMAQPKGDTGPSSKAFAEANAKMHGGMDIAFTGNPDVDFVRGMIAHHRGGDRYGEDRA